MIMTSETIKLNLIPGGELPVLHSSQFDTGRALTFEIYDGEELFTSFDAYDISLHARKVDGTIIGIDTYNVDSENHQVIFFTTEQLTACAGKNICELVFTDPISGTVVGSCNFWLEVEGDPYSGGIDSASDIENLSTQIASIVDSQLNNYYTKEEIDDQIETIVTEQVTPIVSGIVSEQVPPIVESELSNYYTKSETDSAFYNKGQVDTLLSGKADTSDLPDMNNYYDKTTTDTLLASKANTSTTYTKTEVDNLIDAIPSNDITTEINTPASVMTFNDGGNDIPVKRLEVVIDANVSGITEVNIVRSGKNIFDGTSYLDAYIASNNLITTLSGGATIYALCKPDTTYTVSKTAGTRFIVAYTTELPATSVDCYGKIQDSTASEITITTGNDAKYIVAFVFNPGSDTGTRQAMIDSVQIEEGSSATTYETPDVEVKTISLGETLTQGGTLEAVSGLLTRTDTTTKQLTGVNLPTKTGINNVFADTGNIEQIEYFNDKADDIAAMISLMTRS